MANGWRRLALGLAACLMGTAAAQGSGSGAAAAPGEADLVTIRVGFLADLHGTIFPKRTLAANGEIRETGGLGQLLTLRRRIPFDLFIFGGDIDEGGGAESIKDKGRTLNRLLAEYGGLDVRGPGNHETEFGFDQFVEREELYRKRGVKAVCTNIKGIPWYQEAFEKEIRGLRVAVVHILTEYETDLSALARYARKVRERVDLPQAVEPFSSESPRRAARRMVARYRGKADVLLLVAHTKSDVARRASAGFAYVYGAHEHRLLASPEMVRGVPFDQAGAMGEHLLETVLTFRRRPGWFAELVSFERKLHPIRAEMPVEPAIAAETERLRRELSRDYDLFRPVARLPFAAVAEREMRDAMLGRVNRVSLAGLIATAVQENGEPGKKVDLTLFNGNAARNSIPPGIVTRKDILETTPANKDFPILEMTGAQLDRAFQRTMDADPMTQFAFGPEFSIHTENGSSENPRMQLRHRGKPLPPGQVFRVAVSNFIAYHILQDPRHGASSAPVIDSGRALEAYLARVAPLPPRISLRPLRDFFRAGRERLGRAAAALGRTATPAAAPPEAKDAPLLWDYGRATRRSILEGYLALSYEVNEYAAESINRLEQARAHYWTRYEAARSVKPRQRKLLIEQARKWGVDPQKAVDAYDSAKLLRVLRMLAGQKAALLRETGQQRGAVAERMSLAQNPACLRNVPRCLAELNQLRREVDQTIADLDRRQWRWMEERMQAAGDLRAGNTYGVDEAYSRGEGRENARRYFERVIQAIPDAGVRQAAEYLTARFPKSFWSSTIEACGNLRRADRSQPLRTAEHTLLNVLALKERQTSSSYRKDYLKEIAKRPYLRSLAEEIGVEPVVRKMQSYEILGALLQDVLPLGWVKQQLQEPGIRRLPRPHPATPWKIPHEMLGAALLRTFLEPGSELKLDPWLTGWTMGQMVRHSGPASPGEAGATFAELRSGASRHLHLVEAPAERTPTQTPPPPIEAGAPAGRKNGTASPTAEPARKEALQGEPAAVTASPGNGGGAREPSTLRELLGRRLARAAREYGMTEAEARRAEAALWRKVGEASRKLFIDPGHPRHERLLLRVYGALEAPGLLSVHGGKVRLEEGRIFRIVRGEIPAAFRAGEFALKRGNMVLFLTVLETMKRLHSNRGAESLAAGHQEQAILTAVSAVLRDPGFWAGALSDMAVHSVADPVKRRAVERLLNPSVFSGRAGAALATAAKRSVARLVGGTVGPAGFLAFLEARALYAEATEQLAGAHEMERLLFDSRLRAEVAGRLWGLIESGRFPKLAAAVFRNEFLSVETAGFLTGSAAGSAGLLAMARGGMSLAGWGRPLGVGPMVAMALVGTVGGAAGVGLMEALPADWQAYGNDTIQRARRELYDRGALERAEGKLHEIGQGRRPARELYERLAAVRRARQLLVEAELLAHFRNLERSALEGKKHSPEGNSAWADYHRRRLKQTRERIEKIYSEGAASLRLLETRLKARGEEIPPELTAAAAGLRRTQDALAKLLLLAGEVETNPLPFLAAVLTVKHGYEERTLPRQVEDLQAGYLLAEIADE